ncbi:hypothetical protein scyTo_0008920 [Scyliorhinus torazame]|uniref:non-specific serine/threonine protein kinase n=1 Tax=Scyliorhinus torazame TaxID=75743 RepID=A0A401PF39_SCYTO|nr:hypothetical protein [Scyliorhinus torazame]
MASGCAPPKLEEFILTEKLGSGTYATVYKAYRKVNSREVVAIKCVSKKSLNKASVENLLTEIEILKTVRHPHIVQLKDFQISLLVSFYPRLSASALQYLHQRNISHLDLKPQNVLLSSFSTPHLKLADFGFAQHMSPWDEKHVLRGSPLYMAPEMVCRQQYDARADLWSVGVILYEALFGRPPFASKSFTELEEKIRSNRAIELPPGARVSGDCRDLLLRLLERDPERRMIFEEFFTHPLVDLDHMPGADSLEKAVTEYISRAEELKALVAASNKANFQRSKTARDILKEMSRDKPRLHAALETGSAAIAKEEEGDDSVKTLELYQQSLGELLLILASEPQGRRRVLLHKEMRETQNEAAAMDQDPFSESVQSNCSLQ